MSRLVVTPPQLGHVRRTPPAGVTGNNSALTGVSCPTVAGCDAIGTIGTTGNTFQEGIIERWNGAAWTVQDKVLPPGDELTALAGISCVKGPVCEAVGTRASTSSGTSGDTSLLILRYS